MDDGQGARGKRDRVWDTLGQSLDTRLMPCLHACVHANPIPMQGRACTRRPPRSGPSTRATSSRRRGCGWARRTATPSRGSSTSARSTSAACTASTALHPTSTTPHRASARWAWVEGGVGPGMRGSGVHVHVLHGAGVWLMEGRGKGDREGSFGRLVQTKDRGRCCLGCFQCMLACLLLLVPTASLLPASWLTHASCTRRPQTSPIPSPQQFRFGSGDRFSQVKPRDNRRKLPGLNTPGPGTYVV